MKKKIIFVQSFKFLDFHYNLYEINELKKNFDVECFDLTSIKNNKIDLHYRYLKNKSKISTFKEISFFKKKILELHDKYKGNLVICFLHFPTTFSELFIYFLLIRKKVNLCIFHFNNFMPLHLSKKFKFVDRIIYALKRLFTRPRQIINQRKILMIHFIIKILFSKIYPKYIFVNSNEYFLEYKKKFKNIKIHRLHDWDGSNFIRSEKKFSSKKKNLVTYLSAFSLNSASDSAHFNVGRRENSKIVLQSIDKFFSKLEKKFRLKVQIAKHPREEENFMSPIYKGKKRYASKYHTRELVQNSRLVITTMSSAVSYAALLKKPLLFIVTNEHFKNVSLINTTKAISKFFDSDLINIDLNKDYKINFKLKNLTKKRYKHFTKNYLISEKYRKMPNCEILTKIFK